MMIGGGASSCRTADHGIGVTEANSPSLADLEDEKYFGSENFDNLFKKYSLNLWVKGFLKNPASFQECHLKVLTRIEWSVTVHIIPLRQKPG